MAVTGCVLMGPGDALHIRLEALAAGAAGRSRGTPGAMSPTPVSSLGDLYCDQGMSWAATGSQRSRYGKLTVPVTSDRPGLGRGRVMVERPQHSESAVWAGRKYWTGSQRSRPPDPCGTLGKPLWASISPQLCQTHWTTHHPGPERF